ncbi:FAD synthase, partial [Pseudolycoriella hygida]
MMDSETPNGNACTKSQHFDDKLRHSLAVISKALEKYKLEQIFLSFNGGKDCTVLLHLVHKLLKSRPNPHNDTLLCIYLQPGQPFDEVESFVSDCSRTYFPIIIKPGLGTKQDALFSICNDYPNLKACFMGCRRTDPYCHELSDFEMTTKGWPELMRINPLLDWTCDDIWNYLRNYDVPYCSLYDIGYTSLGDRTNTVQNPHLKYLNSKTGKEEYRPAYHLKNADALERIGRFTRPHNGS